MSKWKPEQKIQINFRAPSSLRDFLEDDARVRHFRSVQELVLDVLRTYKETKEPQNESKPEAATALG